MVCTDGSTLMAHVPVPWGYLIIITASTRWTPLTTRAALPLHTDWTGPSLVSYCSIRSLLRLVSYWCHRSSQICWLKTTAGVCGSKCIWVQLGPLLRVSQDQNQVVGQPGLLSEGFGEESISKPTWSSTETVTGSCRTEILGFLVAVSQGLLSAPRAPCILSHGGPSIRKSVYHTSPKKESFATWRLVSPL